MVEYLSERNFALSQKKLIRYLARICFTFLHFGCIEQSPVHHLFTNEVEIGFNDVPSVPQGAKLDVQAIAINSKGQIYICDRANSRVLCLAPDGSYLREIGRRDKYSGDIPFPIALIIDIDDNLYIVGRGTILVYSGKGDRLKKIDLDFLAQSIAIDLQNNVYVSGYKSDRVIHKLNLQEGWVKSFGEGLQHDHFKVKRHYSGGMLAMSSNRLYLNRIMPYSIDVFDLDGNIVTRLDRPELNFKPHVEITGSRYTYYPASSGGVICAVDKLILNTYYLIGKGRYIDIYDVQRGLIWKDIPFNAYLLGADQRGNIYFKTEKKPGGSIFRAQLISPVHLPIKPVKFVYAVSE